MSNQRATTVAVRRRLLKAAPVACVWLAGASASAVCPCVPLTVEQAYRTSTLVFTGEVSGFAPVDAACETVRAEDAVGALYTVRVLEELKGPSAKEHRLFAADPVSRSGSTRADGSVRLARWSRDVGKRLLWFASGARNLVNSCASSEMVRDIGVKLTELRQLRAGEGSEAGIIASPPDDAAQSTVAIPKAGAGPCRPPPCG